MLDFPETKGTGQGTDAVSATGALLDGAVDAALRLTSHTLSLLDPGAATVNHRRFAHSLRALVCFHLAGGGPSADVQLTWFGERQGGLVMNGELWRLALHSKEGWADDAKWSEMQ